MKTVTKLTPYIICGLAAFFYVYDYFIQVSPAVMTHQLMETFQIGAAGLGVLGSVFFYAYAGMQIPAGLLLDRYKVRDLLTTAVIISAFGVLIFSLTSSFTLAAVSRFLVGFGSAFSFVSALYLVSQWFPHKQFALVAGIVQFAGCIGSIFGEAPLAHAVNYFGWRNALYCIAIATFVLSFLFWFIIRERNVNKAIVKRSKNTMSSWRLFTMPAVWWIALIGFLCWVPVASIGALWGVPYLMKVFNWSNTTAAGYCSLFWLSLGVASPIIGWLSDRFQRRKIPFYFCFALGALGSILLIYASVLPVYITVLALLLLGLAPAIQSLTFGIAKDILPQEVFGTATGFINMAPIVGGGISQVVIGLILSALWDHQMQNNAPTYSLHDYQLAMILIPVTLVLGFVVTYFFLPETYCQPQAELETVSSSEVIAD